MSAKARERYLRIVRVSQSLMLFFLLTPVSGLAQLAPPDLVFQSDNVQTLLNQRMVEISFRYHLSKEIMDELREQLPALVKTVDEMEEPTQIYQSVLETKYEIALIELMKPFIPEDDHQQLVEDTLSLDQSKRNCAQQSILWIADQKFSLSVEQQERFLGMIDEAWNDGWTANAGRILYDEVPSLDVVLQSLEPKALAELFGDARAEYIEQSQTLLFSMTDVMYETGREGEDDVDVFTQTTMPLVKLRIAELDEAFGLDEQQKRRLEVAARGACMQAAVTINVIRSRYMSQPEGDNMRDAWELSSSPGPTFVFKQKAWVKGVEKALTADQLASWEKRQRIRREQELALMPDSLATALTVYMDSSAEDYIGFRNFIANEVPERVLLRGRFATSIYMTYMDPEKYKDVMSNENFKAVSDSLTATRASFGEQDVSFESQPGERIEDENK